MCTESFTESGNIIYEIGKNIFLGSERQRIKMLIFFQLPFQK